MRFLIAFDLDGTLVDSQRDLAESANRMLAAFGARPLGVERVAAMVGDGARKLVERVLAAARVDVNSDDALGRFLAIYADHLLDTTRPYDGIAEVVRTASARGSLAVLTNKPEAMARRLLEAFALAEFFSVVIGGDGAFPRKPNPAGLQHQMEATGASPQTALLVGDSMVDVETARRAGTRVCAVSYGFGHLSRPLDLRSGEFLAASPAEILEAVSAAFD